MVFGPRTERERNSLVTIGGALLLHHRGKEVIADEAGTLT
jgi:hypothetical protein